MHSCRENNHNQVCTDIIWIIEQFGYSIFRGDICILFSLDNNLIHYSLNNDNIVLTITFVFFNLHKSERRFRENDFMKRSRLEGQKFLDLQAVFYFKNNFYLPIICRKGRKLHSLKKRYSP